MLNMTNEQILEMGNELGYWLDSKGANRGWYTCLVTGKKFRGEEARNMLKKQDEILEAKEEMKLEEEAILEKEKKVEAEAKKEELAIEAENQHAKMLDLQDIEPHKITNRLVNHIATSGRPIKTTTINCKDCGKERVIKTQDAFQVVRCVECQKKHRNKRRAERRREKRLQEKANSEKK